MSAVLNIDFSREQDWENDPKHLLFVLARYKFVAKMLEGQRQVLEVGCGDAFASKIVRQHVQTLTCSDRDNTLLEVARKRDCAMYIQHDLVKDGPVGKFDAAYAIDVLEHVDPTQEYTFLSNLAESVDDIAIIGMPSLESQRYASENSKRGHVNCKTAAQLRATMRKHFRVVLMFGMNDETLTTGFDAMRHYLLAVGVK